MPGSSLTYAIADPVAPLYFPNIPLANFNFTTDTINLGTTHNFVTGNHIWLFFTTTGSTIATAGGISAYRKYFVIVVDSTTIKLANSLSNATNNVAIDITSFGTGVTTGVTGAHFMKTSNGPNYGTPGILLPEFFPAYAESEITFNSSVSVEINFTIPAYTPVTGTTVTFPIAVLLRDKNSNACWGAAIRIQTLLYVYNGSVDVTYGIPTPAGSYLINYNSANIAAYNQKYVITPSRTIECWYGAVGGSMTLYYTTTALAANTELKLEFGSNFSFCRVTDCNIKYL